MRRSTFIWLFLSRSLGSIGQAVSLILAARYATPSDFGALAATLGIGLALYGLTDFGVSTLVLRSRSLGAADTTSWGALRWIDLSSPGLVLLTLSLMLVLGNWANSAVVYSTLPLAVWVISERGSDAWLSVALADGDTLINLLSMIVRRVLPVLFAALAISWGMSPVLATTMSMTVASLMGYSYTRSVLSRRLTRRCSNYRFRDLVADGWPFWVNSAMGQVKSIDVFVVGLVAGAQVAGIYALPARFAGPIRLLPGTLGTLLVPHFTRVAGTHLESAECAKVKLPRIAHAMMAALGIALATLAILGESVVLNSVGVQYADAVPPFQIMLSGIYFFGWVAIYTGALQGLGESKFIARCTVYTTLLSVPLVAVGAYISGAFGAAVGMSCGYLVNFIAVAVRFHRASPGKQNPGKK